MKTRCILTGFAALAIILSSLPATVFGAVLPNHPRILLTPAIKAQLTARKNANDPRWLKLKAEADLLKTYPILPYGQDPQPNTIYYNYQGEGWYSAAIPLALVYQMTGDISYSNKLFEIIDEMIRAQYDPANAGNGPLVPDNYYATRSLGPVLGITFDWCYDQLSPARKVAMVKLMNEYYVEMHDSAYQRNDHADGNYYVGHLICSAMMGYGSYGDNPKAQEMIDYARIRFDGTPSALIDAEHTPEDFFSQLFEGGTRPQAARAYNGPVISAAPFKGGFNFQGWAYGSETYNRIIDYMLTVSSATGENLVAARSSWLSQIFRALKHSLMPNRFEIDPNGDFSGRYGAVMGRSLPQRLAFALADMPDGPAVQHFVYSEIAKTSPFPIDFPDELYNEVYSATAWEDFLYGDTTRPSVELTMPPYYSGFAPAYPQGGATNGAMPYFLMRSSWDTNATWASAMMGAAFYDDHQHAAGGHIQIKRGNDYLVVDAANWKGDTGSVGFYGDSQNAQYDAGAAANTLFFDDYGDYQLSNDEPAVCGGQSGSGIDQVVAAEQTNDYSYLRSDFSSAYNHGADTTDPAVRTLEYFYRNVAYLRAANIFVVFDQTKAITSNNPRGQYRKHMRWHFPDRPTVSGNTLKMEQRDSRVNMSFLLPDAASIMLVDETHNPDPCDGLVSGCNPYGFNSGTFRVEVSDPAKSLTTPYLAVIEPTSLTQSGMTSSKVTSTDGNMIGASVNVPGKGEYVMMFNNVTGQIPAPISSVTYSTAGASSARHTLGGMMPGMKYATSVAGDVVTVTQNASGNVLASAAGVIQFGVTNAVSESSASNLPVLEANYPNPFNQSTTINFVLPKRQHVTLTIVDALGRTVRTLVDGDRDGGRYSEELNAEGLPKGSYVCSLQCGAFIQIRKCVVMK